MRGRYVRLRLTEYWAHIELLALIFSYTILLPLFSHVLLFQVISLMLFLLPKTASWEEKNSSSKKESRDELCWGKIFITMMNASNIYYFRQYSVNCYLTQLAFRIFVCAACGVRPSWKTTNTFPLNLFQTGKLGDKCDASLSPSFSFVVFHAASHKLSSWTREFCD